MKGLHNWWHCGPVNIRLYSLTSLFHCTTTIYMIHKCGSDFIRDSDCSISTSSSIMSSSNTTTTYSYTSFNCSATRMLLQFRVVEVLHSQKIVVIVLWALSVCSQTWLVKWLIQNVLQLEVIYQFSRHYKQCQCQIFMEYTCVYTNFFYNWMDRFECDGLHDEKLLRGCEEFDSLSENQLISFDQQAICN